ncbi:hypothetical protein D3C87_2041830 [compost metagenome]
MIIPFLKSKLLPTAIVVFKWKGVNSARLSKTKFLKLETDEPSINCSLLPEKKVIPEPESLYETTPSFNQFWKTYIFPLLIKLPEAPFL